MSNLPELQPGYSEVAAHFLAQNEQTAEQVVKHLAQFIAGAQQSLDFAVYDMRLSDPLKNILAEALAQRANAGVSIRIAYDADKPETPNWEEGMDPAPRGTGQ